MGVIGLIATGFVPLHLSRIREVMVGGPFHVGKQYNTAECDDAENQQWPQPTNQNSKRCANKQARRELMAEPLADKGDDHSDPRRAQIRIDQQCDHPFMSMPHQSVSQRRQSEVSSAGGLSNEINS